MSLMSGYGAHHNPATFGAHLQKELNAIAASDPNRPGVIPRAMGGPIGSYHAKTMDEYNAMAAKQQQEANDIATGKKPRSWAKSPAIIVSPISESRGGGGGGGGGGGRMGPQDQRKIMNVGPRTTAEYTAKHGGLSPQRPSALDAAYSRGDFTSGYKVAQDTAPAATPMEQGGGYNLNLNQFDKPNEPTQLVTPPNEPTELVNRAKGGPMKIGQKPYLVGEEGPELIMPRANGDGYVLPADVTQQLLPMMTKRPTPRNVGGIMEMITPNATFSGGATPYGPVYGMRQTESQLGSPQPMTMEEAGLAMQPDQRMIVDNGYQVDLPALSAGDAQSIPLQPDVVTGPWASRAMPADTTGLQPYLQNQVSRLSMTGAKPISKYPGQTFNDRSAKSFLEYGEAMPGDTVEQLYAKSRQYQQGLRDPYAGSAGSGLTFEEMQQRMALRGMMYGDDYRDRQARNQTQADLAARAARVPIGTPTAPVSQIPGMPMMSPSTLARVERNQERFLRSPEGAQIAMQSGQKLQERMAMIQPVPIGDQGDYVIPLTGQYVKANGQQRQMTPEEAAALGMEVMESKNGVITYGRPKAAPKQQFINTFTGNTVQFDADIDTSSLDPKRYTPLRRTTTAPAAGSAAPTTTAPAPAKAFMDRFKK